MSSSELTHITPDGSLTMVDVSPKPATKRRAMAEALVSVNEHTFELLTKQALPKGDAVTCAKIAGIMAAKQTGQLIPLCHSLNTTFVNVEITLVPETLTVRIQTEARAQGETGVEMEAIVAAEIAAATIYDMCKAVQKDILIHGIRLLYKSGGRSGEYKAQDFAL